MKRLFIGLLLFFSAANISFSQTVFSQWPKLSDFHDIMSATFHPSEEGNLEPIKKRSGELVAKANALQKSQIPAAYNKPEIRNSVKKLNTTSLELNLLVKNKATDKQLMDKIKVLHDIFHQIVGLCKEKPH
ncbi:hypothetical protein [Pedobacter sandarakinus]|uniref:hypothetical protein n=1 Tax=Pedobacter sandarakinus TaxID=353156 RepID=UPI0022470C8D|nr:hypothetical protein [Pedobacter sandarakinus]MCX2574371.1 hypothetical protein [Pedobacter sandarakinus]